MRKLIASLLVLVALVAFAGVAAAEHGSGIGGIGTQSVAGTKR